MSEPQTLYPCAHLREACIGREAAGELLLDGVDLLAQGLIELGLGKVGGGGGEEGSQKSRKIIDRLWAQTW